MFPRLVHEGLDLYGPNQPRRRRPTGWRFRKLEGRWWVIGAGGRPGDVVLVSRARDQSSVEVVLGSRMKDGRWSYVAVEQESRQEAA